MKKIPKMYDNTVDFDEQEVIFRDVCTDRGFPLGGIGTGGFNILTDGGFAKFRTNHNWFRFVKSLNFPKGSFIALRIENDQTKITRILRRKYHNGKEYDNITNIEHTKFMGKIPRFSLEYNINDDNESDSNSLPVMAKLTGFTSLIPQNIKDSSLPCAFFTIKLKNNDAVTSQISILFSFENILGLGGSGGSHLLLVRDGPVAYRRTRGNYQEVIEKEIMKGIRFKTEQNYSENNPRMRTIGEYLFFMKNSQEFSRNYNMNVSYCKSWDSNSSAPEILEEFNRNGRISSNSIDKKGKSGAFCVDLSLGSGENIELDFYIIWWTPYYVIEKNQRIRKYFGKHNGIDYG
ncbi:MAG: hypothetical protein GF364_10265, partial [Candidatus Lokiarchaeota archaeon]|nr:hypothetical protein [Candidatus Lokiarchaeota archaeon]